MLAFGSGGLDVSACLPEDTDIRGSQSVERLRVGLAGAGSMGANHARVVLAAGMDLVVFDPDVARAEDLVTHREHVASHVTDLVGCDAVIVASPTETHERVALPLLEAGVPLLVEKPLATTTAAAERLIETSRRCGTPLMCGFVERFNPAIATARVVLNGQPIHLLTVRHSPPTPHVATSVVFDLLIHDIDLALSFMGQDVHALHAGRWTPPESGVAEVADCTMTMSSGHVATLSASRAGQRKVRTLSLATEEVLVEVDLLRQDVTVYQHVAQELYGQGPSYRAQTVVDIPFVRHAGEPLALQFARFAALARGEGDAETELNSLLAPHRVAEAVEASTASLLPWVAR